MKRLHALAFAASLVVSACAVMPTEPAVFALPGTGKSLPEFTSDDQECRGYADERTKGAASTQASGAYGDMQWRYDSAYIQCMYAKGHKVPVTGTFAGKPPGSPPSPSGTVFLPPPGSAPPPPPGSPPSAGPPQ